MSVNTEPILRCFIEVILARHKNNDGICRECIQDWPCFTAETTVIAREAIK